jgi:hypothetical protein
MAEKFVIEKLYAFIAEGEDGEGVCAYRGSDGDWLPLIGADQERVDALQPLAQTIADTTGKRIRLCEFECRVEVMEILPK